jgi:hypothetical protein
MEHSLNHLTVLDFHSCSSRKSARCFAPGKHQAETLPATDRSKELQCEAHRKDSSLQTLTGDL